jgi:putative nucleotidyltransferase with HDIG domain
MITKQDIEKAFEILLERISDNDLKEKTIDVWVDGANQGNWNSMKDLEKCPYTLLTETHGINLIEHTLAVTAGAVALAEVQEQFYSKMPYNVDYDRLIVGGLLHDVGKLLEIEMTLEGTFRKSHAGRCARHPISGAILAARHGLSDEIVNIIACHAKEGDGRPQVLETVLIHQSDFATFNPLVMMKSGDLIL